jgi:hypothetical protein
MLETKCYQMLSSLTIYELKRFRRYLASPLHNEDNTFQALFELLYPALAASEPAPIRADIAQRLYPQRELSNQDYARLFTRFARRIEGFVALEQYYARPMREYADLLEGYNNRDLHKFFPDSYQYIKASHIQQQARSIDYYLDTYRLEALQHEHIEARQERSAHKNLLETLGALDIYYLVTKLRYCAAMLHYQEFLSVEGEVALIQEILAHCADGRYDSVPLLRAYYYTVRSLIEPDEESHFTAMKAIIFEQGDSLTLDTQRDLFAFAIVYCINKINMGQAAYQRELFDLYRDALARDLLLDKGVLTPWDFKNITTIALRNKELTWAESFIEQYQHQLPKAERANAYTFNRARYHFAAREYDRVLELLQSVEYNDVFYLLDSKTTLMKTYYELGEPLPLQSLKESFRILLRRKKLISEQNRVNYDNFARFTMKLFRADVRNKKQVAALRIEIAATPNMADRSWVLEKLDEISPQ